MRLPRALRAGSSAAAYQIYSRYILGDRLRRARLGMLSAHTKELALAELSPRSTPLSRRGVLTAAVVGPACPRLPVGREEELSAKCSEWWALDAEFDHLTAQRSIAEAAVLQQFGRLRQLPPSDPTTRLLGLIDRQFEVFDRRNARCIKSIGALPARTIQDVANKLTIVARLLGDEGGIEAEIVSEAACLLSKYAIRP